MMTGLVRIACVWCLVLIVLAGCSGQNARAPMSSRTTEPEPKARVFSRNGSKTVPSAPAAPNSYVVQRGDTLYSIAWQQGIDVQQLAQLNQIRPPYTIYRGQRLQLLNNQATAAAPVAQREPLQARPLPAPAAGITSAAPRPAAVPAPQPVSEPSVKAPVIAATTPANVVNAPEYDGKWVWPTRGKVLRGFQQAGNGKKGIDIDGQAGQPVMAAASGKVVYVGSGLVGYGRLIIVKHNESLLSAYGHNSKLLVAEGDYVKAGQTIANMGSSGTNRTMLYFEIRKDGKPVNPVQYLP